MHSWYLNACHVFIVQCRRKRRYKFLGWKNAEDLISVCIDVFLILADGLPLVFANFVSFDRSIIVDSVVFSFFPHVYSHYLHYQSKLPDQMGWTFMVMSLPIFNFCILMKDLSNLIMPAREIYFRISYNKKNHVILYCIAKFWVVVVVIVVHVTHRFS